jgi:hydrogenase expression/formation protein HypC
MCLGIPGKIIKFGKDCSAEVDFGGVKRNVQLDLLAKARVGDYVIVHAGFAIQKLDKKDALETLNILREADVI